MLSFDLNARIERTVKVAQLLLLDLKMREAVGDTYESFAGNTVL